MKFVGHLFLQGLMAEASMGHLAHQLLDNAERMERNKQQRDHQVELACELLATVGEALEQSSSGQTILTELWSRLADWKCAVDTAGAWLLGTRTRFRIDELYDQRDRGWSKKPWVEEAMTIEQVRLKAEKERPPPRRRRNNGRRNQWNNQQRPANQQRQRNQQPSRA